MSSEQVDVIPDVLRQGQRPTCSRGAAHLLLVLLLLVLHLLLLVETCVDLSPTRRELPPVEHG